MATGKTPGSRPRAGHGLSSSMSENAMRTRVSSAKPARNRNRVKGATVARRPAKK